MFLSTVSDAVSGWAGWALAHLEFESSVNPTLRPFETLLFSGLPMMIWQKNLQPFFSYHSMVIEKKKIVKWQKFKTALCDLTKKLLPSNFFSVQFWTEVLHKSSNQSGCQIHGWILFKKSITSEFTLFVAVLFYSEWPQLFKVLICLLEKSLNH